METVKVEKLQHIIRQVKTGMLVTHNSEDDLRSRPMYTADVDEEGNVWFFSSLDSPKIKEIISNPSVNLSYSSPEKNEYLSISGIASIVTDQQKIDELFNLMVKAWYPEGKKDSSLTLIKVHPYEAE